MPFTAAHLSAIQTERAHLTALRDQLYREGAPQAADIVRNALAELNTGAMKGMENNFGVNQDAVRR